MNCVLVLFVCLFVTSSENFVVERDTSVVEKEEDMKEFKIHCLLFQTTKDLLPAVQNHTTHISTTNLEKSLTLLFHQQQFFKA